MSEKLFALLLRLYPARFRREYGDDAMQLFQDRLRDERGFLPKLRLWFDLLTDAAFSLPREHSRAPRGLAPVHIPGPAGVPSFHILEDQLPRPGSFVSGTVLALAALGVFGFLLNHGGASRFGASFSATLDSAAGVPAVSDQGQAAKRTSAPGSELVLDEAERRRVITAVITNLKEYYDHPGEARRLSALLSAHERQGDYTGITSGVIFAVMLNRQMLSVTRDNELMVTFSQQAVPGRGVEASAGSHPQGQIAERFHRIDEHFGMLIP